MTFSIVVGFLFVFITQFSKYRFDKPILLLNGFVLSFTLYNLQRYLIINEIVFVNYFVDSLPFTFYALIVPFFYTFTVYYLGIEKKVTPFLKIAVVVFFIQTIVRFVLYPFYFDLHQNEVIAYYAQYEEILNAAFAIFLYYKTFVFVFFRQDLYQELLTFDSVKWIKTFLLFGAVVLLTWILAIAFNINNIITPHIPLYYPLRLATFLLLCWLCYHGFYNYSLLTQRKLVRNEIANETIIEKTVFLLNNSFQTTTLVDKNFMELNNHIITSELYLQSNLSVYDVAKSLNQPSQKISSLIQKNTNGNFNDYINRIRVEKAKKYLKDPNYEKYTYLAIGFECGFNSKSTFYRAFAKITGTNPTDFKNQNNA